MKPVEPAELSGYLDGELDVARTAEVRELLSRDAALLAQFEALRATDANWRAAASTSVSSFLSTPGCQRCSPTRSSTRFWCEAWV